MAAAAAAELKPIFKPNIFPAAWPLVKDWDELDWHPKANSPRSSLALVVE